MTVTLKDHRNDFEAPLHFRSAHELDQYLVAARRTVKDARVEFDGECIVIRPDAEQGEASEAA